MSLTGPFVHSERGPLHLGRPSSSPRNKKTEAKFARVHDFLTPILVPPSFDNTSGLTSWGMMGNDNLGDCTCAACGHLLQDWTAASGSEVTVSDDAIISEYSAIGGYVPGNESTDNGAAITDALNYLKSPGLAGYAISAWGGVNIDQLRLSQALYVFGGINLGVNLPTTAQNQVGLVWDYDPSVPMGPDDQPGSWGGHSIAVVAYDESGMTCVTWGALQKMSWRWVEYYCDEAYAAIYPAYTKFNVPTDELTGDLQEMDS